MDKNLQDKHKLEKVDLPALVTEERMLELSKTLRRQYHVKWSLETVSDFNTAVDRKKPFWHRVRRFLAAENKAGRKAKAVKDFVLIFVPYGRQIGTVTELASEVFKQNQPKEDDMKAVEWIKERLGEKTTYAGLVVLTAVAGIFGYVIPVEVLMEHLEQIVSGIALVLSGLGGIWAVIRKDKPKEG